MNQEMRITPGMKMLDAVCTLAEDSPEALKILLMLSEYAPRIDTRNILRRAAPLILLDALHIYGGGISVLYHNICRSSVEKTLAVLRATDLGTVLEDDVVEAVQGYGIQPVPFDVDSIEVYVRDYVSGWHSMPNPSMH